MIIKKYKLENTSFLSTHTICNLMYLRIVYTSYVIVILNQFIYYT